MGDSNVKTGKIVIFLQEYQNGILIWKLAIIPQIILIKLMESIPKYVSRKSVFIRALESRSSHDGSERLSY